MPGDRAITALRENGPAVASRAGKRIRTQASSRRNAAKAVAAQQAGSYHPQNFGNWIAAADSGRTTLAVLSSSGRSPPQSLRF
jgi:hypothetical protein